MYKNLQKQLLNKAYDLFNSELDDVCECLFERLSNNYELDSHREDIAQICSVYLNCYQNLTDVKQRLDKYNEEKENSNV